ncbi:hypothetical protein QA584_09535 [Anaerocolumna sp. AGMB13025]|uniref:hypothetical protein n=1 Tax=Anaerocolumna sp. AGMB13025 TaxID=3039116 RepID=UPI00241BEF37|nr:hypothetical protein [Anaerocolumna sp. AGMB13025]WFR59308.1 hypothetical protein QA584_09535 [Anaerocolumna sp. AGMB13025]
MEYLSECASNIELMEYNGIIRSERVASKDSSEQGAYFCAVPKLSYACIGEAFPLLLIHDLYDSQGWEKDKPPFNNFNKTEWKNLLRTIWIPEYLSLRKDDIKVEYKSVTEVEFCNDWLPITKQIAASAIQSSIQQIVRYGLIDAWNFSNYLIETKTEYIDFQFWTTA